MGSNCVGCTGHKARLETILFKLRHEIHRQLCGCIVSSDLSYDVGYLKGQTKLCMHSEADQMEVWGILDGMDTCVVV